MGRYAPAWRRAGYRIFDSIFLRRTGRTPDGEFDIYVSPGCQLNVLDPRGVPIDPVHRRFIDRWISATSVIWDIGTNMGLFAFPAALRARNGQVYGFEPDIDLVRQVTRSLRRVRNMDLHLSIFGFALSDTDGASEFLIARYGRSMNKLEGAGPWHDGLFVGSEKRWVATLSMDTMAKYLRPPEVIKIDVEGAEMKVLEGGRATIAKHRPVMLVEGPMELWEDMSRFYRDLDYVYYDGSLEEPILLGEPTWDTVAVPREKWEKHPLMA
ncbi:MAG: FkbM family methyltransferase [Beijerinckiaceae bacterium]|nr:FkbM family methyltransferase [Beijerinckiaceae bacterium]